MPGCFRGGAGTSVRNIFTCPESLLGIKRTGYRVTAGGKKGFMVMSGRQCSIFAGDFDVFETIEKILRNYGKKAALRHGSAKKMERLGEVIDRLGIEGFLNGATT